MNFGEYQQETGKTAVYPSDSPIQALSYVTLGLAGEAGEIANKVKKIIRDNNGEISNRHREDLTDELGDVLWYVSQIATELDTWLAAVAERNIIKLRGRAERGTLQGSGDKR